MKKTLLHILMHNGRLLQRAIDLELSGIGLHHGQGRMIEAISQCKSITQVDLARRMDVKPATVTNMLKPLVDKRLVVRSLDSRTNRAMVVMLTAEGQSACQQVQAVWERVEDRLSANLLTYEKDGLFQGLEKVRDVLGGKNPVEDRV